MLNYLTLTFAIELALFVVALFCAKKEKNSKKVVVTLCVIAVLLGGLGVAVKSLQDANLKNNYTKVPCCYTWIEDETENKDGYNLNQFCDLYEEIKTGKMFCIEEKFGVIIFHEVKLAEGYNHVLVKNGYEYIPFFEGEPLYEIVD